MKKLILLFLFLLLTTLSIKAFEPVFDYDPVEIPAGTFIPVMTTQEISSAYCDDMTKLDFISYLDVFMYESKIIPTGTKFYGQVEKKNEPVIGTNGSLVIKITKMVFPDGYEMPIKGYIHSTNNNILGGEMTQPEKYRKVVHYQKGIHHVAMGVLQAKPDKKLKMGEHHVIASGAELIIVLTSPAWLTHTLTN
ncbi:hypothetical protein IJI31_03560 [bacterium]|nr:hypothetical protein [bacterium]